jgi:hypothetical protein
MAPRTSGSPLDDVRRAAAIALIVFGIHGLSEARWRRV